MGLFQQLSVIKVLHRTFKRSLMEVTKELIDFLHPSTIKTNLIWQ